MTESTPGLSDIVQPPADPGVFDAWDPANVSPLVAYLATESCPLTGNTFFVQGGKVQYFQPWTLTHELEKAERWTIEELAEQLPAIAGERPAPRVAEASGVEVRLLGDLPHPGGDLGMEGVDRAGLQGEQL